MKYLIETKQNKKIGIFSDLHVGVSSDSKVRLNETRKCIDWIIKKFKEEYVDYIIFCGDLFNSRYSVNVNTLNSQQMNTNMLPQNMQNINNPQNNQNNMNTRPSNIFQSQMNQSQMPSMIQSMSSQISKMSIQNNQNLNNQNIQNNQNKPVNQKQRLFLKMT